MRSGPEAGLLEVTTADLKKALLAVHRGDFDVPPSAPGVARIGLQHCAAPLLTQLRGLDLAGVRAVLVCVLQERLEVERIAASASEAARIRALVDAAESED